MMGPTTFERIHAFTWFATRLFVVSAIVAVTYFLFNNSTTAHIISSVPMPDILTTIRPLPSKISDTIADRFNFALVDSGSRVVDCSMPRCKNVIQRSREKYTLFDCTDQYVVIQLPEQLSVEYVHLAAFEFFSGLPKLVRMSYAKSAGAAFRQVATLRFNALASAQYYRLPSRILASTVRFDFVSYHNSYDNVCSLTEIGIYGLTAIQVLDETPADMDYHSLNVYDAILDAQNITADPATTPNLQGILGSIVRTRFFNNTLSSDPFNILAMDEPIEMAYAEQCVCKEDVNEVLPRSTDPCYFFCATRGQCTRECLGLPDCEATCKDADESSGLRFCLRSCEQIKKYNANPRSAGPCVSACFNVMANPEAQLNQLLMMNFKSSFLADDPVAEGEGEAASGSANGSEGGSGAARSADGYGGGQLGQLRYAISSMGRKDMLDFLSDMQGILLSRGTFNSGRSSYISPFDLFAIINAELNSASDSANKIITLASQLKLINIKTDVTQNYLDTLIRSLDHALTALDLNLVRLNGRVNYVQNALASKSNEEKKYSAQIDRLALSVKKIKILMFVLSVVTIALFARVLLSANNYPVAPVPLDSRPILSAPTSDNRFNMLGGLNYYAASSESPPYAVKRVTPEDLLPSEIQKEAFSRDIPSDPVANAGEEVTY